MSNGNLAPSVDPARGSHLSNDLASRYFRKVVDLTVRMMVPLATVALMMGIAKVVLKLWTVWKSPTIASGFDILVTDLLSMFVVIELLKSIIEYFEVHRIRITFIIDAALVFTLREIMIGLFQHELQPASIGALAFMLAVMGGIRIAAVRFSPGD